MNLEPRHPLQRYWDLAAAAVQAEALNVALTLDLFEALCAPRTAHELAGLLGLDAGNTGHLLDLLWSMDLLERDPRRAPERAVYLIAPVARSYLLRASPAWCGDAWRYRQGRLQQAAGMLERQVRQGALTDSAPSPERGAAQWAQAARKQLAQEQHAATVPAALAALARVPESAAVTRLLDLGGGPGWVAIALARQPSHCLEEFKHATETKRRRRPDALLSCSLAIFAVAEIASPLSRKYAGLSVTASHSSPPPSAAYSCTWVLASLRRAASSAWRAAYRVRCATRVSR